MDNPENQDPIYADLVNRQKEAVSTLEAHKKALAEVIEEIKGLPPRDPKIKRSWKERYQREKAVVRAQQLADYFLIRAEQRKAYAYRAYLRAYNQKKAWPDHEEFERYQAERKLQRASRNWEDRVPKFNRYGSSKLGVADKRTPAKEESAHEEDETAEETPSGH